jgi:bifunctional non-homologous end joining protein LigD
VTWVQPLLTLEVEFMEWSMDQKMRAPYIIGFLKKSPEQCLLNEEPL